ncbi:MAG: N-acetylneuraminate synthase family protein [Bacteroidales bacterium]|nr:N-acetylneuraminate synthase family protein [Bacteroidales bacterium]
MKIKDFFKLHNNIPKPFVIAEAGVNHEGKISLAKRLIDEAKEGGADAIKFQTYKAHLIASKQSPSYWDTTKEKTKSQYDLFKKYDSFWKKEYEELKTYCDKTDIEFLSTPFDTESANFLNDLMDAFKISSSDITNKPFIEYICKFNKPVILSTGASNLSEIKDAVNWIGKYKNKLSLLHCVLNYPTKDENANLGMIQGLKKEFPNLLVGYSDHTLPGDMTILETAFLLGAKIIEKHFTFDKTLPGNDHYHAMDKDDLKKFYKKIDSKLKLIGKTEIDYLPSEEISRLNARRSLVAAKTIPQGKIIEKDDITWKRPGTGISPKYINDVIGKKATKNILCDEIIIKEFYE